VVGIGARLITGTLKPGAALPAVIDGVGVMRIVLIVIGIMLAVTPALASKHPVTTLTNGVSYYEPVAGTPARVHRHHVTERKVMHHTVRTSDRNKNSQWRTRADNTKKSRKEVMHRSKRDTRSRVDKSQPRHQGGGAVTSIDWGALNLPEQPTEGPSVFPPLPAPARERLPEDDFSILANYAYSETLPAVKPADEIKQSLVSVPEEAPHQEIKLVSSVLGLNVGLMSTFARIESDLNPKDRTGSYMGLFQLSRQEFSRYGPTGGNIFNARDNAIAAAVKIEYEANLFKIDTRHIPSDSDLYLIHQQGMQGAAQHLAEPERPAWKSMCATDEGKQKGTGWCKKAIWGNTLPFFKRVWKSVEDFTSGAFVRMWSDRVAVFLGRPGVVVKPQPKEQVEENEQHHEASHHKNKVHEARVHHHHNRQLAHHHHSRHYAKA
jgi:hypothetical protein